MPKVDELLTIPALSAALTPLHLPEAPLPVTCAHVIESPRSIETAPPGALLIFTRHATAELSGYSMDVALRRGADAGVAAIALRSSTPIIVDEVARRISTRSGIALVKLDNEAPLADMVIAVTREVAGGAERAINRLEALLEVSNTWTAGDLNANGQRDLGDLIDEASRVWGATFQLAEATGSVGTVEHNGRPHAVVVNEGAGVPPPLGEAVRRYLQSRLSHLQEEHQRSMATPILSAKELLTETLLTDPNLLDSLAGRARRLGVPVDGSHVVCRIQIDGSSAENPEEALRSFEQRETMGDLALRVCQQAGGAWYRATSGGCLVLIRCFPQDPGPDGAKLVLPTLRTAVSELDARFETAGLFCGVGNPHAAIRGLRTSSDEAAAAVGMARNSHSSGDPILFDASGLRRMLLQWYAVEETRQAVDDLLAPLDELGSGRADEAVQTLRAYLDNSGSTSAAAEELHVHRNTVTYRLNRIFEKLDVDPDNPDDRLALLLACRARTV